MVERKKKSGTKRTAKTVRSKSTGAAKQPVERKELSPEDELRSRLGRGTVPPVLNDPKQRAAMGLQKDDSKEDRYIIELNLNYSGGIGEAIKAFRKFYARELPVLAKKFPPRLISKSYFQCYMSCNDWRKLVKVDEQADTARDRLIYKIWPDFKVRALIDRSVATVKGDAALRAYTAKGSDIVWAVVDSGVDVNHVHFGQAGGPKKGRETRLMSHTLLAPVVAELHRDFTSETGADTSTEGNAAHTEKERKQSIGSALKDHFGHGTHVAGIIAGGLSDRMTSKKDFKVFERVFSANPAVPGSGVTTTLSERTVADATRLHGIAPECKLISIKVLDDEGSGYASSVMRALEYVREELNGDPKMLRVHGVNLSLGYEFDAEMFACGQSPLCVEVDRLVRSGVVVVVAAGNTGYGRLNSDQRVTRVGLSNTINDPGNAALAITVGATHRDSPHTYGVSYFSSKGPTSDGRLKPDLVAPGERITSCASPAHIVRLGGEAPKNKSIAYVDDSGTSMAAPHVSGAVAAFLSIRREFIQKPEEVKRIFLETATSLGRERYFEGHGLVDLMRAIQAV